VQQDDEMQFFQEDAVIPVHVQGDAQALNMDNFIQLGVGMQNIMMAYHDIDSDSESDGEEENPELENEQGNDMLLDDNISDPNLEMFHFNDFVPPEVAHIQLGMVKTHFFPREYTEKFSAEGMLLWEKYFAPHIMDQMNNSSCKVLDIPTNWFNFITLMLLTPEKFDWTKKFLNSSLWNIIKENEVQDYILFLVPDKCVVSQAPKCSISVLGESSQVAEEEMPLQPPSAPKRKRRGITPLVDTEVRKSPRILELNEGFKNHSICKDKNCLSCSSAPPDLKSKIVKNLATSFCKVEEENLNSKLVKRVKKLIKGKDKLDADGGNQKGKKKDWK
jgi:hypothetical protein